MRLSAIVMTTSLLFVGTLLQAQGSTSSPLEKEVESMVMSSNFDSSRLDADASILIVHDKQRKLYTRDELTGAADAAKKAGTKYRASNFRVTQNDNSGRFASITYKVTWTTTVESKKVIFDVVSHEIWERRDNKWYRLFAAMDSAKKI
jgi:hypothetical protein